MKITVNERLMSMAVALLLASMARAALTKGEDEKLAYANRRLAAVQLPSSVLGDDYEPMEGFRIDDFSNISRLPAGIQRVAHKLKQEFAPLGIVSLGDFSLLRKKAPLNSVTVRVFIFDTAEHRAQWCRKKYAYDGWEQQYEVVDSGKDQMHVLDSTQINKRIYHFDRIWITSHQLTDGTEHQKAAQFVIKQLTTPDDSETKSEISKFGEAVD